MKTKKDYYGLSDIDGYWDIIEVDAGTFPPARMVHGYSDGPFKTKNQAKKAILAVWESAIRDLKTAKAELKSKSCSTIKPKTIEDFDEK